MSDLGDLNDTLYDASLSVNYINDTFIDNAARESSDETSFKKYMEAKNKTFIKQQLEYFHL